MISFESQKEAVKRLQGFADANKHSLVIEGFKGSGKTHLAEQYGRMLGFRDRVSVKPKVSDIKETFEEFAKVDNPVLIVVENLDEGVPASAYVLLKYMEEPSDNLYIVVTCSSKERIPDTIVSRSMTVSIKPPTESDLELYAKEKYPDAFKRIRNTGLWLCASCFSDIDEVCCLSKEKVDYIKQWSNLNKFNDSVKNVCWNLDHYPDGSEVSSDIIVKYVLNSNIRNMHVVKCCKQCMDDLNSKRIARYLTLSKLSFDLKYCE